MELEYIWGLNIGEESRKTWLKKTAGFWQKYCKGRGLDIGYKGYLKNVTPILPNATGVDVDYPGYDGENLPFLNLSQDFVYSSHVLEHIDNYRRALREWFRVLKSGGYMIVVVPHRDLYEKRFQLPSQWNKDHKRFYTPASLLAEIEDALEINTYRIRHLQDNDEGHDYTQSADLHSLGEYEIEVVIQKL